MSDWFRWPPTMEDLRRELSGLKLAVWEDNNSVGINHLSAACLDSLPSGRWPMIHRLTKIVYDEKSDSP